MTGDSPSNPLDSSETIVAQATVSGRGALAVVRISGRDAHAIAGKVLDRWPQMPRSIGLAGVHDEHGAERRACVVHR